MKLIVGLGNPGRQYVGTRHNMGYEVVGLLARQHGAGRPKSKFHAEYVELNISGEKVILLSPLTYMNRSGLSVSEAKGFYKLNLTDILIVCDDLSLPVGKIRIRTGGSSGGQKGLIDIIRLLGTEEFPRLRLGIGHPGDRMSVVDWVLSGFSSEEKPLAQSSIETAAQAAVVWLKQGINSCMNQFN